VTWGSRLQASIRRRCAAREKSTDRGHRRDLGLTPPGFDPPSLEEGSQTRFNPGDQPFSLWVSNDDFTDGSVFTEPALVARINKRLARQPYKATIYPNRDKTTGRLIRNSYLIGWEYSTNDDFQDVVCQVDNVVLLER